jgi:2-polyprenyl-3-methyl-5-hydroxy-6-metoxy-1,4-benzoquinol methylase
MKTYSSIPGIHERGRLVPCPLCHSEKYYPKWDCSSHSFVKCFSCGVIYQNPQTPSEQILSRYDKDYFDYERRNEESFLNLMKLGLEDVGFYEWEGKQKKSGAVLDIGCATGALLNWLRNRGWKTEGIEICRPSAEYAQKERGLTIHTLPLEELSLKDNSFSLVHSSHVIEHLNDPLNFVHEIFRILKPGGYFICVTPNTASLQALMFRSNWRSAIADHLVLFSKKRLSSLLKEVGLLSELEGTWGGIAGGILPSFLKKPIDKMAKKLSFGDVVIILAQKP